MKVVILCGGKGMRSFPFTHYLPKPMMPLAGTPILVHVIRNFIRQGYREFVLAAGYLKSVLDDYFEHKNLGAEIRIVQTGEDADTGARILACREHLDAPFIATYSDGLCDIPIDALVAFHGSHSGLATVSAMPMFSQYGVLSLGKTGLVEQFREKPIIEDHWINVGFLVFDPEIFEHWSGESLEREVLPNLLEKGLLYAYRHTGFFKSVDSYKDVMEFEEMLGTGTAPWIPRGLEA